MKEDSEGRNKKQLKYFTENRFSYRFVGIIFARYFRNFSGWDS